MGSVGARSTTTKIQATGIARSIDKKSFTVEGNGVWELNVTGVGGGQILDERDSRRAGFGSGPAYGITVWDVDYNIIGQADTIYFGSLNDAKRELKERLKRNIK